MSGNPLLSSTIIGDQANSELGISGTHRFFSQSPNYTISIYQNLDLFSDSSGTEYNFKLPYFVNRYFKDSRGLFAFSEGTADVYQNLSKDDLLEESLDLTFGIGYGRIISAKPVAQAIAVSNLINSKLSDEKLLEMADIISKASGGYYTNVYKDDASIEYYNALEEISGKPGTAMKIMQIMSSPVFNISERYVGWFSRLGYNNSFSENGNKGELLFQQGFAKPIDKDKQLILSLNYGRDLNENGINLISANIDGTIDHSYNHVSGINFKFINESYMTPGIDPKTTLNSQLYSRLAILNKLIGTGSLNLTKISNQDLITEIKMEFTYFIL